MGLSRFWGLRIGFVAFLSLSCLGWWRWLLGEGEGEKGGGGWWLWLLGEGEGGGGQLEGLMNKMKK